MEQGKPSAVDDLSLYYHLRARLEHEDDLIVGRLLWLMTSQSFFFTAYAIGLNGSNSTRHLRMLQLICIIAIVCSVLIFIGVAAAIRAIAWLQEQLRRRNPDVSRLGLPPLDTPPAVKAGQVAPILLPPMFIVAWVYLLLT